MRGVENLQLGPGQKGLYEALLIHTSLTSYTLQQFILLGKNKGITSLSKRNSILSKCKQNFGVESTTGDVDTVKFAFAKSSSESYVVITRFTFGFSWEYEKCFIIICCL